MKNEKPVQVKRDVSAVMVPSGEKLLLSAGSSVWLTQSLGGSYTVMTDHGYMARIDGHDGDAIGMAPLAEIRLDSAPVVANREEVQRLVWAQLRACFDPEIPVNIVDLGLIYDCTVSSLSGDSYKAAVRFTLTAQGCGMGQFLKQDIRNKLLAVPGIDEADVELVWDPPWNQSMLSGAAKQQLGIE
jgi:probable FeS assembly SUF system protein SufT